MEALPVTIVVALAAVFVLVALVVSLMTRSILERRTPERQRLKTLTRSAEPLQVLPQDDAPLVVNIDAEVKYASRYVPKSPAEVGRVRRRLMRAGYPKLQTTILFIWAEIAIPVALALLSLWLFGTSLNGLLITGFLAILGYLAPDLILSRLVARRRLELQNGLADALDLLIVCVESGSSLDQGILKTSEELGVSYPALAEELRTVNVEVRAGKPRVEAFRNFAARTGLDDVRALVAMLVQTDRFGTSVAQALRTLAATVRAKRRQQAEERAQKVGVKLVFPLVFLLFPAFYVVTLGPAVIQFVRVFFGQIAAQ